MKSDNSNRYYVLRRRELRLDRLGAVIRSISASYSTFEFYTENRAEVEAETLRNFAATTASHADGSTRSDLQEMHALTVANGKTGGIAGDRGIFAMIAQQLGQVRCSSTALRKCITVAHH